MRQRHFGQDSSDVNDIYQEMSNIEVHILDAGSKRALHSFVFTPEALIAMRAFHAQYYSGDNDSILDWLGDSDGQRFVEDLFVHLQSAAHACLLNVGEDAGYSIEEPDSNTLWPLEADDDDAAVRLFREFADKRAGYGWWALHRKGEQYDLTPRQKAHKWTRICEYHRERPQKQRA